MTLRTDHVAGGAAIALSVAVFALSGDLPVGTLSFPGAGMLPKLLCGLLAVFGLTLIVRAGGSPFSAIDWSDVRHAAAVLGATAAALALYTTLGFVVSMALLLFGLAAIERRNLIHAAVYGVGVSVATDALFAIVLKSPLERGLFGF
jgi:hypothetical protein